MRALAAAVTLGVELELDDVHAATMSASMTAPAAAPARMPRDM